MEFLLIFGSGVLLIILMRSVAKSVTVARMNRLEDAHNGLVNQTKNSFINAKNDIDALGKVLGVDFVKSESPAALWDRIADRFFRPFPMHENMYLLPKEPNVLQRLDAIEKHLGLTISVKDVPAHTVVSWETEKRSSVVSKRTAAKKVSPKRK